MGVCVKCGIEVSPGDIVWDEETSRPYCSVRHQQEHRAEVETAKQETLSKVGHLPKVEIDDEIYVKEEEPYVKDEERSWECPVCGFMAKNKAGMVTHVRAKHKAKIPPKA